MVSFKKSVAVGLILCLEACSSANGEPKSAAQAQPKVFTYAPALNAHHRETMRRGEEVSIPGTPMRNSEKWTLDWDVVTSGESNLYKRSLTLVGLKINVNGVDALRGDEVKASPVTIEVITDKESKVVGRPRYRTALGGDCEARRSGSPACAQAHFFSPASESAGDATQRRAARRFPRGDPRAWEANGKRRIRIRDKAGKWRSSAKSAAELPGVCACGANTTSIARGFSTKSRKT